MDPKIWTRDASKVHAALVKQPDGSVLTKRPIKVYLPEDYTDRKMAEIGSDTLTLGVFAMVVDDTYYAVMKVNAKMRLKPTTIATVKFGDRSYLELTFAPGSCVIASSDLIKSDTLVYQIFNYFISNGKVPWFLDYEDLAALFDSAEHHAGVRLNKSHVILEMIAATISRSQNSRITYYRHTLDPQGNSDLKPVYISLRNISLGPSNTPARLLGSYWADGLTSSLVNQSKKLERVEQLLRS